MAEVTPGADAPAVNETPVAAEVATPVTPSTADPVTEVATPEPPAPKTLTQDEVNKIVAKEKAKESRRVEKALREQIRAEAERDFIKQQMEERTRQPQPQPGEPKQEDFKDYDSWIIARAKWEIRQETAAESRKREEQSQAQTQQQGAQERAARIREKIDAAREEFPDIEEVISGEVPYTQPMVAFFEDSEHAGKLMHHLGTNVKEATRISALSPAGQFRELVKLEAKLTAPPTPTKAPPPIVPSGGTASVEKRLEDANPEEFAAIRRRQIAARKGKASFGY